MGMKTLDELDAERCRGAGATWWCTRYKNCSHRVEDYLGDTQPTRIEVIAVRVAQWLNGCVSLDWEYENWVVTLLRETGPGFRLGYFFTSLYIVVVASFLMETPLVFAYDLHHPQVDMVLGNWTLVVTFYLWVIDFAVLALGYYLVRHGGTPSRPGDHGECTPFYRVPTRRLREQRESEPDSLYQSLSRAGFAAFYTAHFFLGVFAMHTVLSHMYIRRNVWFAALLGLKALMALMASTDDLTNIGSPWGIQEASKLASVLLSFRGVVLVPFTVYWSAMAIAASFPPSWCAEC